LWDNKIPFEYDKLISFDDNEDGDYFFSARPDFSIKDTNILIEYWGMKYGKQSNPRYD